MAKKWPKMVIQRSFIKEHSFRIRFLKLADIVLILINPSTCYVKIRNENKTADKFGRFRIRDWLLSCDEEDIKKWLRNLTIFCLSDQIATCLEVHWNYQKGYRPIERVERYTI
jgi:hypothetical protein